VNVHLLHPDRDLDLEVVLAQHSEAVSEDLGLDVLLDRMADGDQRIRSACRTVLLAGLRDVEVVRYRQAVVADALRAPEVFSQLYEVIVAGLDIAKRSYSGLFRDAPDAIVRRAVERLKVYTDVLRRLREDTAPVRSRMRSEGVTRLFGLFASELDEPYLREVEAQLEELTFPRGVLFGARLGRGAVGTGFQLKRPRPQGWLSRSLDRSGASFELADRDDDGIEALGRLRDQALAEVAVVLSQASDDIEVFLRQLRDELAVLIGVARLHAALTAKGEPTCLPEVVGPAGGTQGAEHVAPAAPRLTARGLYDPALSLQLAAPAVGNDLDADGALLVLITGANQGGKSTLLRSIGTAQLLLQAGFFVPAATFLGSMGGHVFTHFGREEDQELRRGKLEEELNRMRAIVERIRPGDLLLANESFAATNEREGSELARQVFRAHLDLGVRVVAVTHLYDLAESLHRTESSRGVFLRAQREEDGERTFRIEPGAPLPTSYGQDLYRRIFGEAPTAASGLPATPGDEGRDPQPQGGA
jgi:hypothetical protein